MKFYTNVKKWGKDLLVVGYEDGQRFQEKVEFQPTLYFPTQEPSPFKSLSGFNLAPRTFENMKEQKKFVEDNSDVTGFDIYGQGLPAYEWIGNNFTDEVAYNFKDLRVFSLDIETYAGNEFPEPFAAKEKITAITIFDSKTELYHVWGEAGRYKPHRADVRWYGFDNEVDMLYDFVEFWENNYPDVLTGWYSRFYDVPYIVNRIRKLFGEKICNRLSPWGIILDKKMKVKRFSNYIETIAYEFYGIAELDYMDLYQKYVGHGEESFSLGHIANIVLGEAKLDYEGSLHNLYMTDYQKYVEYNVQDVALLPKLEAKLKYLEMLVGVAYFGKVASYADALGSVKWWEVTIYNHLKNKGIIAPLKLNAEDDKDTQYEGAFVVPPRPGLWEWCNTYDVKSLYPNLIRSINIGPDTLIPMHLLPDELRKLASEVTVDKLIEKSLDLSILKKYNVSMSGNGKFYSMDKQSFLSELMEKYFNVRIEYQKEMRTYEQKFKETGETAFEDLADQLNIKQQAMKIIINSAYGCCGNAFFQYFSVDNAEAITISGQVTNRTIQRELNAFYNRIIQTTAIDRCIGGDTDSTFFVLKDLVDKYLPEEKDIFKVAKFLHKISSQKTEPEIVKIFNDMHDYMNHYDRCLKMTSDVIANKVIITGKKKYVMNILNSEGKMLDKPKLKVKGIEIVKSDTPKVCREELKKAVQIIIDGDKDAMIQFVKANRKVFNKLEPEQVATPKGVNDIEKYIDVNGMPRKSTPMGVRAANNYNKMLKKYQVEKVYEEAKSGGKIKFVALKMPNQCGDNLIGFVDKLPKEFGLHAYVDYETQFSKTFIAPLQRITDVIGWNLEKVNSLDRFMKTA